MVKVMDNPTLGKTRRRTRILIRGAVQGVGFRPFIYRLATSLGLTGFVLNNEDGVKIEVEGDACNVSQFLQRLESEKPQRSIVSEFLVSDIPVAEDKDFIIAESTTDGEKEVEIQPDIATCPDCLSEIFDPSNRRYLYPFTNCVNCGPRFSIIEGVPYDRKNTSMRDFEMCDECASEYRNPLDRRYHAQPIACPKCGPHVELWDNKGRILDRHHLAILLAAKAILQGKIVALKGLGGFQLLVLAENDDAVRRLRWLKKREEKPFALMFPEINSVLRVCHADFKEQELLNSPESPIVLLRKKSDTDLNSVISPDVAPINPYLGVMLPYTPLHHILMRLIKKPVVATSGNISDEPICIDNEEAIQRLGKIAELFLVHNRRIVRHIDDSVVAIVGGEITVLRRARGFAPLPVYIPKETKPVLALGAHLKNTVCFGFGKKAFISQHIGDLETLEAFRCFRKSAVDLPLLYEKQPEVVVCDLHPDYLSTKYAEEYGLPVVRIQHHYAHILSCMAENNLRPPVLGVAWDGTGYGQDGTIWGGEFLKITNDGFERIACLKPFLLAGGDHASRECRRSAIGVLFEIFGKDLKSLNDIPSIKAFRQNELNNLINLLKSEKGCIKTSSAGRLFDAVSSILGIRQHSAYEGQGAMELEFSIGDYKTDEDYPFLLVNTNEGCYNSKMRSPKKIEKKLIVMLDWTPVLKSIINDYINGICISKISAKFHNTLVKFIVEVARIAGEKKIVLSGGCFQNRYLTERTTKELTKNGFEVYRHKLTPCNDGGISLGQVMAAALLRKSV